MTAQATSGRLSRYKLAERGTTWQTEVRAGLTTFMVMSYIIFLNSSIIAKPLGLDPVAVSAGTALVAGLMTLLMGYATNYPFALAAGLGINAIVAFSLPAKGISPAGAMGVIVLEGLAITVLVFAGLREAIMNAVPLALKRAIGVGIGLFILFIGFSNGGLIVQGQGTPVTVAFPSTPPQFVFLFGLLLTLGLYALKVKAALIISIIVTTLLALAGGVTSIPSNLALTPNFSTFFHFDLGNVFSVLGLVPALLTIFAIMLSDFFDTMGTVTGIAAEAGLANSDGSVPNIGNVLKVDSIAAWVGGIAGVSSNTTYIESAAGVAEGGRTGLTAVTVGVLFLLSVFLAPIAGIVPAVATAPALVLVGYLMFTLIKGLDVTNIEEGVPALLTMILMPLTYDITVGIGAGFISWVLIKVLHRKRTEIHPLMWLVTIGFVIYFLQDWILSVI